MTKTRRRDNNHTYVLAVATGYPIATLVNAYMSCGPRAVAYSPDGATLATGDWNGRIDLQDIATGRTNHKLTMPSGVDILSLAFSHGGTTISAGYLAENATTTGIRQWTISPPA